MCHLLDDEPSFNSDCVPSHMYDKPRVFLAEGMLPFARNTEFELNIDNIFEISMIVHKEFVLTSQTVNNVLTRRFQANRQTKTGPTTAHLPTIIWVRQIFA